MYRLFLALSLSLALASQSTTPTWNDSAHLLLLGVERLSQADYREAIPLLESSVAANSNSTLSRAWLANGYHLLRRLDEAGVHYRKLLELEAAKPVSDIQRTAILRFAPRVFQVRSDPFGLLDAVAIHHPSEPLIAYHFFWQDDIDFPEDNDPCDHELVWARYDAQTNRLTEFSTYFHGRILSSAAAVADAHQNSERPRVNIQWGKHGSLPLGWESLNIQSDAGDIEKAYLDLNNAISLKDYNYGTWQKLNTEGRRLADHPLSAKWPRTFAGSWNDFTAFDKPLDIVEMLVSRGAMTVSRWNNATLQQRFIPYNFRPKTEWPNPSGTDLHQQLDRLVGASLDRSVAPSRWIDIRRALSREPDPFLKRLSTSPDASSLNLPALEVFRPETPRFPNVWFDAPVSRFPRYSDMVSFLKTHLREIGYRPDEVSLNEGADDALSIEHLQYFPEGRLEHAHAIHIRLFWKRLEQRGLHRPDSSRWRVAASVHYEVEHANRLHADVEVCPFCGRTGGYAAFRGNLVERVHDPLGVELLIWGENRGSALTLMDGRRFPSIAQTLGMRSADIQLIRPNRQDMNTEAIVMLKLDSSF